VRRTFISFSGEKCQANSWYVGLPEMWVLASTFP
jgi:hypothetical protein